MKRSRYRVNLVYYQLGHRRPETIIFNFTSRRIHSPTNELLGKVIEKFMEQEGEGTIVAYAGDFLKIN